MAWTFDEVHLPKLVREHNVSGSPKFQACDEAAASSAAAARGRVRQRHARTAACCPPLPPIPGRAARGLAGSMPAGSRSVEQLGRTCAWLGKGARSQSSSALPTGDEGRRPQWWPGYGQKVNQKPSPLKRLKVRRNCRRHLLELNRSVDVPLASRDMRAPGYIQAPLQERALPPQPVSPGVVARQWQMSVCPSAPSQLPAPRRQVEQKLQTEPQASLTRARAVQPVVQDWAHSSAALHAWAEGLLESARQERVANVCLAPTAKAPTAAAHALLDIVAEHMGLGSAAESLLIQDEAADLSPVSKHHQAPAGDATVTDETTVAGQQEWQERALAAFQAVALLGEVSRDHLSRALQVLGHPVPREDWIEAAAAKVSTAAGTRSFFDKADFLSFVAVYEDWHQSNLQKVFLQASHDDQGRASLADLAALLPQLGVSPMPGTLRELAREVTAAGRGSADADAGAGRGELEHVDVEQFARIYALGSSRAGFTCKEHAALAAIFSNCCRPDGFIDASGMQNAMAQDRSCILADATLDAELVQKIESCSHQEEEEEEATALRGLPLRSFLVVMRERRELGWQQVRAACEKLCTARPGLLAKKTLLMLFEELGFLGASPEVVQDAVKTAGLEGQETLDVEDAYLILQGYSENNGCSHEELQQLDHLFHEHDLDGSGGIDPTELRYVMRWLGYPADYEQLLLAMEEFDLDNSRQLEQNELAMLVAKYRKKDICGVRDAFALSSSSEEQIDMSQFRKVLLMLGYTPSHEQVVALQAEIDASDKLGLWDVVRLVDKFRSWEHKVFQANHGFSKCQLRKLRKQFEEYDPDDSGLINPRRLLEDLEPEASTCKQAHERACHLLRLGVSESKGATLRRGSTRQFAADAMVSYPGFLKIMRTHQDQREYEQMKAEEDAVLATGFSRVEVRELRHFHSMFDSDASGDLSLEELAELISKVVPSVTGARAEELHNLLVLVDKDGNRKLDFVEFLRLVRLLQDTDWEQINARAGEVAEGLPDRAGEAAERLPNPAGEAAERLPNPAGEAAERLPDRAGEAAERLPNLQASDAGSTVSSEVSSGFTSVSSTSSAGRWV